MWAMINLPSWMFLSSFQAVRESILASQFVISLVHLGRGVFGSDFGSVAFVMQNVPASSKSRGTYRRLFEKQVDVRTNEVIEGLFRNPEYNLFEIAQGAFHRIPGSPIVYWMGPAFFRAFEEPSLGRFIMTEGQNKTADNDRYLRFHWEVSQVGATQARRWIPYAKGGKFRKWYGNVEYVVDWSDAARRSTAVVPPAESSRSSSGTARELLGPMSLRRELGSDISRPAGHSTWRAQQPSYLLTSTSTASSER
jgi:hypothetical protein